MVSKTTKQGVLTAAAMVLAVMVFAVTMQTAFAVHGNTGESWTEPGQEYFCHSNLSDLNITSTVTDSVCDIIGDSAGDWNSVANSSWELTESRSSAIDFRSSNLASRGLVGIMNHWAIFGTIITANVELSTHVEFGDATVDSDVYDIYTVVKHEMGHLPTLYHNSHSGDENTSVMRTGSEIGHNAQRTITSNDAAALAGKY